MNFLVVDDDLISRKVLKSILSKYGTCDVAVNGSEALDLFKNSLVEKKPYDLICLDIMMPEMDGHETLVKIREHEKNSGKTGEDTVKIVMVTALSDFDNIKEAFTEQCEAYIVKPINLKKVKETLIKIGIGE